MAGESHAEPHVAHGRDRDARASSTGGWPRAPRSMAGWQLQDLDLRERGDVAARPRPARRAVPRLPPGRRTSRTAARPRRAGVPRGARTCRSTPTAPHLYSPDELYDGLAAGDYAGDPGRPRLRLGAGAPAHDLHAHARPGAARPRGRRRARGVGARPPAGRRDGRARPGARHRRLRATPPGWDARWPRAGLTVATGGGPGAMEAANLGAYLAGHDDAALDEALEPARRRARVRAVGAALGRGGVRRTRPVAGRRRRRWACRPGSTATSRRTRSPAQVAKYFKNAIREDVLLHVCTRRDRVPAGPRRHRAGGVPGRLRELLRRRRGGGADGAGRGGRTGPSELPVWPLLRTARRGPRDGAARCTWWTTSTRWPRSLGAT